MEPVRLQLTYRLAAPVARVWPILADTERLNRQLGLPPTTAIAVGEEPVRHARVRARLMGLSLEWREEPFEFVEREHYWVRRRLTRGPIREFNGGMRFREVDGATEVRIESEFLPAGAAALPFIHALLRKTHHDCDAMIEGVRTHLAEPEKMPYQAADRVTEGSRGATLQRLRAAVDPTFRSIPLADALLDHIAGAGDAHLVRMRPFQLARMWGSDRSATLSLCLRAAREGVLDLSWDLLCPNCQGARNRWKSLDEVHERSHCDDCQISFGANFDQALEVTFRPNPRYRLVDDAVFCSGGPRNTPHVAAQTVLEPSGSHAWQLRLDPGRYRLRNLTADLACELYITEEAQTVEARAVLEEDRLCMDADEEVLCSAGARLQLANHTSTRQQVILERLLSFEDRATAARVSVCQEFRGLFAREALSPGVQLGIRTLPLMFTDLKGSTALYNELGDASAYALVRDHFALLQSLVSRHGGGVVKTVGDAVMAAFPAAADALACALEVRGELARFNASARQPIRLKLGIHQGPCIAARSYEERLDYFGSTVNLAARTHEQSSGDDVVVTEAIFADPAVAHLLEGVRAERFVADLRGIGEVALVRLLGGEGVGR